MRHKCLSPLMMNERSPAISLRPVVFILTLESDSNNLAFHQSKRTMVRLKGCVTVTHGPGRWGLDDEEHRKCLHQ